MDLGCHSTSEVVKSHSEEIEIIAIIDFLDPRIIITRIRKKYLLKTEINSSGC